METKTYPFSPALFPQIRYILLRLDPAIGLNWKFAWNEEAQDHLLELTAKPDGFKKFDRAIESWRVEKIEEHLNYLSATERLRVSVIAKDSYSREMTQ